MVGNAFNTLIQLHDLIFLLLKKQIESFPAKKIQTKNYISFFFQILRMVVEKWNVAEILSTSSVAIVILNQPILSPPETLLPIWNRGNISELANFLSSFI